MGSTSTASAAGAAAQAAATTGIRRRHSTDAPPSLSYRRKFCLCLGVNNYAHWPKLIRAKGDAIGLAGHFAKELGFESTTLIEDEVTKENIERTIKDKFADILQPSDLFVLIGARAPWPCLTVFSAA